MPTYDYRCRKCNRRFSLVMSISEHGRRKPVCPRCKSRRVEREFTAFFAKTSKKS